MSQKTKAQEVKKRVDALEKSHGKLTSVKDELRLISMEYADIRSRLEVTDVLVDKLVHDLNVEKKMRRLTMLLILILLLMTSVITLGMSF